MNIVTYCRVSTDDQNLAVQQTELTEFCRRNGWKVAGDFSDIMSGAKKERPGLDAMLARCAAGGIEAVVVVKLDRLGRSLLNVVSLIDELGKIGVATICTSQGIDTRASNPCGKVTYQILAAVSEFERNLIRERTKAGLVNARARGKILGRPSAAMAGVDRAAIVAAWRAQGGKNYRELGQLLGGVSGATAWRVARVA